VQVVSRSDSGWIVGNSYLGIISGLPATRPVLAEEAGADSELTMPFAIAILQIELNRAHPVRGKGLSHLSF